MELRVHPPAVRLGRACAERILEEHASALPDLGGVVALAPDRCGRLALRGALLERARARNLAGLLLPRITSLRPWVLERAPAAAGDGRLAELLELAGLLNSGDTPLAASQANPWAVAGELLELFERLSLDDAALPDDREGMVEELRRRYGIDADAPEQLRAEAEIAHRLWRAWTRGGGAGAAGRYREALLRFAAPPDTVAVYVCGYEQLARLEAACLERLDARTPVRVAARPEHLLPLAAPSGADAAAAAPGAWADALESAFARGGEHLKARAEDCGRRRRRSPLAGRLRIFRSGQAELHARGIDIQIRRWLRAGRRDIGLVTEDRKLARRVRALLERAGVAVRDYSGWSLSTTSAATVLEKWLACLAGDFHHQDFLDLLKSPFARPCPGIDHEAAVVRLEARLRRSNAAATLARYRDALGGDEPDKDGLALLDAAEEAAGPWRRLRDAPDARAYFGALQAGLERLGCARALAADEAGQKVLGLLEQAAFELRDGGARLPRAQWNLLVRQLLEEGHYAPPARGGAAITLITLGQAHLCAFSRLIVAGMDRRHYPRPASRGSCMFNDAVRESLGLPGRAARRALDLQRFRALLLAADEALLTHQTLDQDEPLLPSPWLEQLRIFHELAWGGTLEDPELAALALDDRAAVSIRERPGAGGFDRDRPRPPAPRELLPERLSASGHQDLIDCPYRFFVHRCLGLREADTLDEDPDGRHFGLYVHRCLQAFHAEVPGLPGPWAGPVRGREAEARELLREIGERQLERAGAGHGAGAFRARWEQILTRYVARQREAEDGRKIEAAETASERPLPGGPTLRGRIDRLDRGTGGGVVLDYKTGAKISRDALLDGEKVQLTSYALLRDDIDRVEYWWLTPDARGGALDATALEGAELGGVRARVGARLSELYGRLRAGAELPAHGDAATCGKCAAAGVCRRAVWADSAAVEDGAQRQ